ncbi:MAG: GNAT family N-acetyltransferase [Caldilineaceae bacterium]|nr:GNAT family N-acetyltransferase [Caldilineaceae bacterium]
MTEIRQLTEADLPLYAQIGADAYPGVQLSAEQILERYQRNFAQDHIHFWGLFRDGKLLGAYQHYDFVMTLLDRPVTVGGIGGVAVALLHKKQRVAYQLLQHFVRDCRRKDQPLAWLYPFRPDFYRRMGFGYGTKLNQYRLEPTAFARRSGVDHLRFATEEDRAALTDSYNRYAAVTNGMIRRREKDFDQFFNKPEIRCVVYWEEDQIRGYLTYQFTPIPGNYLSSDLHVREVIYENPAALNEILSFIHLQFDQTSRVVLSTQDEFFALLLENPLNGSNRLTGGYHESNTQAVGLMPRVVDTARIFAALADHNFGAQSVRLRLDLLDDFLPENAGTTILHVADGRARLVSDGAWDVMLRLHVRDFSPLLVGAVNLRWLAQTGLAELDDWGYLDAVHQLFLWHQKPICFTGF